MIKVTQTLPETNKKPEFVYPSFFNPSNYLCKTGKTRTQLDKTSIGLKQRLTPRENTFQTDFAWTTCSPDHKPLYVFFFRIFEITVNKQMPPKCQGIEEWNRRSDYVKTVKNNQNQFQNEIICWHRVNVLRGKAHNLYTQSIKRLLIIEDVFYIHFL